MAYSARQYAQALHELSSDKPESEQKQHSAALAAHLKKEGRLGIMPEIIEHVQNLQSNETKRNTVRVAAANKLSAAEQEALKKQFPALHYEFTHDETLLAGIVVQRNNSVWYANLAKAAQQLRASIVR